ncbi:MAG: hypothetical protein JO307_15790 [Bryobacterales bacterium]|nr:hypothetical protein [Bryobacterales bacterium]MBV9397906.1 hypothetical protein [Bryobacterales bacterium]
MRAQIVLWLSLAAIAAAQNAPVRKYPPVPRTADGKPDFTGVWQGGSNRIGSWEEANNGPGVGGATPVQRAAPPEKPPYQPWAAAKVLEFYNRRGIDDPEARCAAPGVPRITTIGLFPMQILQTPQTIGMLYEVFHVFRVIPLNGKHPDDLEPSYMGDSVGHWEGDTLVVDVTGFNDKTWLGPVGSFHSEALHVVERYTRVDYNTIRYDVTMEDPEVFTKPWNTHSTIMLREGTRLREYECAENNADMDYYEKLLKNNDTGFLRK